MEKDRQQRNKNKVKYFGSIKRALRFYFKTIIAGKISIYRLASLIGKRDDFIKKGTVTSNLTNRP